MQIVSVRRHKILDLNIEYLGGLILFYAKVSELKRRESTHILSSHRYFTHYERIIDVYLDCVYARSTRLRASLSMCSSCGSVPQAGRPQHGDDFVMESTSFRVRK